MIPSTWISEDPYTHPHEKTRENKTVAIRLKLRSFLWFYRIQRWLINPGLHFLLSEAGSAFISSIINKSPYPFLLNSISCYFKAFPDKPGQSVHVPAGLWSLPTGEVNNPTPPAAGHKKQIVTQWIFQNHVLTMDWLWCKCDQWWDKLLGLLADKGHPTPITSQTQFIGCRFSLTTGSTHPSRRACSSI